MRARSTGSCAPAGFAIPVPFWNSIPPSCMHILRLEIGIVEGVWWGGSHSMGVCVCEHDSWTGCLLSATLNEEYSMHISSCSVGKATGAQRCSASYMSELWERGCGLSVPRFLYQVRDMTLQVHGLSYGDLVKCLR